ncbi:DUF305 domain-containing protein [Sphaerisporangium sp. B11E5]|uniref:DUF305 domain-containing protein n=1 Tax=Sphaerisporangium sp. B11E5 TaxID=3153563 RepID=UPI00325CA1F0
MFVTSSAPVTVVHGAVFVRTEIFAMNRLILTSVAFATAGLLATAGGSEAALNLPAISVATTAGSPGSTSEERNEQDVMFATMMIPHHRQAIVMAEMADERASSSKVKDLAKQILAEQESEIRTMNGWLADWGRKAPSGDMPSMDHAMRGMYGMMSPEEMNNLERRSGTAFDRAFLTMMVRHHQGAISMAEQEQNSGRFDPAKELAATIASRQAAEISQMRQLLRGG